MFARVTMKSLPVIGSDGRPTPGLSTTVYTVTVCGADRTNVLQQQDAASIAEALDSLRPLIAELGGRAHVEVAPGEWRWLPIE